MNVRDTLLLADSKSEDRAKLRDIFAESYNLLEAENSAQAMLLLEQNHPCIAAVLLDTALTSQDSCALMREMRRRDTLSELPVVLITSEVETVPEAYDLGVADIIGRGSDPFVVQRRVNNLVDLYRHKWHLEELVREQADALRHSNEVMVDVMSGIIEYRSAEAGRHTMRIRRFTRVLLTDVAHSCPEYGLTPERIEAITGASALHDIGKISIPDAILNKKGRLTPGEFEVMKRHAVIGSQILEGLKALGGIRDDLRIAYDICRHHHERWDGAGYPDGLKGEDISIGSQAVGLVDAYDALTTQRIYKPAYPYDIAVNMILNGDCGCFSPRLLECFKHVSRDFAALALSYADGGETEVKRIHTAAPGLEQERRGLDTLHFANAKYHALLRYTGATVLEADLEQGVHHLVYSPDANLRLLKASSLDECLSGLIHEAVHPEDRNSVQALIGNGMEAFFRQGRARQACRCRIRGAAGGYYWYVVTVLRMDAEDDTCRKVLVAFCKQDGEEENAGRGNGLLQDRWPQAMHSLFGSAYCVYNDSYFTLAGSYIDGHSLLGYNNQELSSRFHGRALELLLPEERDAVRSEVARQLEQGRNLELETRMLHKSGHAVWVLVKGELVVAQDGLEYLYGVLVDITRARKAQAELNLTLERHKIILEQTDDVIFEWDMQADTLQCSGKWQALFGYDPMTERISERLAVASHLHPEDLRMLLEGMRAMRSDGGYREAEVRIAKADGRYLWCRLRATPQCGASGKPIKAVGVIINIDKEKRDTQDLLNQAERDPLTKLLNKRSSRGQVERYFAGYGGRARAALLIIDLDDFKRVNDRYGHMCGDAVLLQSAAKIKRLFRSGDGVARIGGDEFMVFMRDLTDHALLEKRCMQIVQALRDLSSPSLPDLRLSCSIGAAVAPEHGTTYQELFQHADRALYQAKRKGKDCFACYDPRDDGFLSAAETALGARIDSDAHFGVTDLEWMRYAFHSLYEATDINRAINSILETIGRQMNVSRVYIFEKNKADGTYSNTFEWCGEGVAAEIKNLQGLDLEAIMHGWENSYNERDIFCCTDISKLPALLRDLFKGQGIQSMLLCAIRDKGEFSGFVGFDECASQRLWLKNQIDALTILAEIMSIFLFKMRAQDETLERLNDLRSVLDGQNAWVYVIDPESCELLFLNAKTLAIAPGAKAGMRCHQALLNRPERCRNCPATNIFKVKGRQAVIDNEYLKLRVKAEAASIRWQGRDACLITCHEVERP